MHRRATPPSHLTQQKTMTNTELDLSQLQSISGGAAANYDFCVDPLILKWKLQNPGKELPKWLGGGTEVSSKF